MQTRSLREFLSSEFSMRDIWLDDSPKAHVEAWLLSLVLNETIDVPPLRPPAPGERTRDLLERVCLERKETGVWPSLSPALIDERLSQLSSATDPEDRNALLALAALTGDDGMLQRTRGKVLAIPPGILVRQLQGEMLFLSRTRPAILVEHHADIAWGWIHRMCRSAGVSQPIAPLLALAIQHCEHTGRDLGEWLREGVTAIDADLCTKDGKVRTSTADDFDMSTTRKPTPGMRVTHQVNGTGGRIEASLPAVLEHPLYSLAPYLIEVLEGELPLKAVRGARTRKDLRSLLSHDDSAIVVQLQLSGDIRIEPSDLDVYRMRLQTGIEWVNGCFPETKGSVEIVIG